MANAFDGPIKTDSEMDHSAPTINLAFNFVNVQMDEMRGDLETLFGKISPVVGPARPQPGGSPTGEREPSSEIAQVMFSFGDQLQSVRERIQEITERIEF